MYTLAAPMVSFDKGTKLSDNRPSRLRRLLRVSQGWLSSGRPGTRKTTQLSVLFCRVQNTPIIYFKRVLRAYKTCHNFHDGSEHGSNKKAESLN